MSILESIEHAQTRRVAKSQSEVAWDKLTDAERTGVLDSLNSGAIGVGKMSDILKANGARISRHFLLQITGRA